MNREFTLNQGAGQKLEFAVQRNGGTPEDIEYLSTGENFRLVILLRTGKAKLVEITDNKITKETKPTPSILELISTIVVNATIGTFVAKEKFVINIKRNAKVKISYLSDNFKTWFLSGGGKTEDPIMEQILRYHTLRQSSVDGPIITELGGEKKSETTLSEMFSLMENQKHGKDGVLLKNGYSNIFYIRDSAGVLRSVRADWSGDGWDVDASSVEDSDRWFDANQVFSRNSVLESSEALVSVQA